jgi:hypothetical protein
LKRNVLIASSNLVHQHRHYHHLRGPRFPAIFQFHPSTWVEGDDHRLGREDEEDDDGVSSRVKTTLELFDIRELLSIMIHLIQVNPPEKRVDQLHVFERASHFQFGDSTLNSLIGMWTVLYQSESNRKHVSRAHSLSLSSTSFH